MTKPRRFAGVILRRAIDVSPRVIWRLTFRACARHFMYYCERRGGLVSVSLVPAPFHPTRNGGVYGFIIRPTGPLREPSKDDERRVLARKRVRAIRRARAGSARSGGGGRVGRVRDHKKISAE